MAVYEKRMIRADQAKAGMRIAWNNTDTPKHCATTKTDDRGMVTIFLRKKTASDPAPPSRTFHPDQMVIESVEVEP